MLATVQDEARLAEHARLPSIRPNKKRRDREWSQAHAPWLQVPPAAACGGRPVDRRGGFRGLQASSGIVASAWEASYDTRANRWHIPAVEQRYQQSIDQASTAWLMPIKAVRRKEAHPLGEALSSVFPSMPTFGAGFGSVPALETVRPYGPAARVAQRRAMRAELMRKANAEGRGDAVRDSEQRGLPPVAHPSPEQVAPQPRRLEPLRTAGSGYPSPR
jgi:hypothetical protein